MIKRFFCLLVSFVPHLLFAQPLSLQTCRTLGIEHNRGLHQKEMDLQEADLLQRIAKNSYLPKFDAMGVGGFMPGLSLGFSTPGAFLPTAASAAEALKGQFTGMSDVWMPGMDFKIKNPSFVVGGVMVSQPVYLGGKIRKINRKAAIAVDLRKEMVEKAQVDVIEEIDRIYWEIVSMQEATKLGNSYIKAIEEVASLVEQMYRTGMSPRSEVLKVTVEKEKAALDLLRAENGVLLAGMKLNQLIGRPLTSAVVLSDSLTMVSCSESMQDGLIRALENRQEILLLKKGVQLEEIDKKIAAADYLPQVALTAGYFGSHFKAGSSSAGLANGVVGGGVSVPIFHWSEARNRARISDLNIARQQSRLTEAQEMIVLEVNQTWTKINEAQHEVSMCRQAMASTQENLDAARDSFRVGMQTLSDLLKAQTEWQRSRYNFVKALKDLNVLHTTWLRVTGNL